MKSSTEIVSVLKDAASLFATSPSGAAAGAGTEAGGGTAAFSPLCWDAPLGIGSPCEPGWSGSAAELGAWTAGEVTTGAAAAAGVVEAKVSVLEAAAG